MVAPCIFCSAHAKKSKEHIWPDWMAEYFARADGQSHNRNTYTSRWHEQLCQKEMQRPGHLSTVKLRVVCESCNNGWMSRLESETKRLLKPMMEEEEIELNGTQQRTLALWAAVKAIVGEYAEPDIAVTPKKDRRRIKEDGAIPEYYAVYLGYCASGRDNAWMRTSMTLSLSHNGPSPSLDGFNRNTQSVALLCGPVFLYVLAVRVDGIDPISFIEPSKLSRIHPSPEQSIIWPLSSTLSNRDMGRVAHALEDLKELPNVLYGGDVQ